MTTELEKHSSGKKQEKDNTKEKSSKQYFVNVEGAEYDWDKDTITTSEIRTLGNLPADQPVICERADGSEIELGENETIELKPGHRYGRAAKYKRG
ncbi:MAG: multiubiquitin domain-containing protein [Candidatus Heimdallarchaeota archaeon]|nr:multiubiquitin domain-containing protein [Candidatus Heimdallarchaeota archaeon]